MNKTGKTKQNHTKEQQRQVIYKKKTNLVFSLTGVIVVTQRTLNCSVNCRDMAHRTVVATEPYTLLTGFYLTQVSGVEAVCLILFLLLFLVLWLAAVAFLIYDNHLRR